MFGLVCAERRRESFTLDSLDITSGQVRSRGRPCFFSPARMVRPSSRAEKGGTAVVAERITNFILRPRNLCLCYGLWHVGYARRGPKGGGGGGGGGVESRGLGARMQRRRRERDVVTEPGRCPSRTGFRGYVGSLLT